jgi:hypothetical protein
MSDRPTLPAVFGDLHEHPGLIDWSQSQAGRVALWVAATAMLCWHGVTVLMPLALAFVMVFPEQRRLLLSFVAVAVLAERVLEVPDLSWTFIGSGVILGIGCLFLFFKLVQQFERWPGPARRHPIVSLHVGIWVALVLSTYPRFGILSLLPFMAWRLSFMVMQGSRGKLKDTLFKDHLFYLVPVYGGTVTPYGKGLEFLSRHEAADAAQFSRSQLAGMKLLVLAAAWYLARDLMDVALFGESAQYLTFWPESWRMGLSRLPEILQEGANPAWYQGWGLIYLELIRTTLSLAAAGHVIVGCIRLLGFNIFRNTYKPLLSQSILEFWNRFYYYFKELMVEFFFYPAYLRLRGMNPAARMFTAIFSAAFLGNMYHHILARPETVTHWDLGQFWIVWGPRFVYCFLLALGVGISMVRQQKIRQSASGQPSRGRLRRIAGVWTFFSIIQIWNVKHESVDIFDCARFALSLVGL